MNFMKALETVYGNKTFAKAMNGMSEETQKAIKDSIKTMYEGFASYPTATLGISERRNKVTRSIAKDGIFSFGNDNKMSQITWYVMVKYQMQSGYIYREFMEHLEEFFKENIPSALVRNTAVRINDSVSIEYKFMTDSISYGENKMIAFPIRMKVIYPEPETEKDMAVEHEKHNALIKSLNKNLKKYLDDNTINEIDETIEKAYTAFPKNHSDASRVTARKKIARLYAEKGYGHEDYPCSEITWAVNYDCSWDEMDAIENAVLAHFSNYKTRSIGGYSNAFKINDTTFIAVENCFGSRNTYGIRFTVLVFNDGKDLFGIKSDYATDGNLFVYNSNVKLRFNPSDNSISGREMDSYGYNLYTRESNKTLDAWIDIVKNFDGESDTRSVGAILDKYGIRLESYIAD